MSSQGRLLEFKRKKIHVTPSKTWWICNCFKFLSPDQLLSNFWFKPTCWTDHLLSVSYITFEYCFYVSSANNTVSPDSDTSHAIHISWAHSPLYTNQNVYCDERPGITSHQIFFEIILIGMCSAIFVTTLMSFRRCNIEPIKIQEYFGTF